MPKRDILLIVLVCAVWGMNFIAGAKGVEVFSPILFMVLRFALVLTFTLPFLRRPPGSQWLRLATVCLFMGALHFTIMFWALQRSSDVTSIVILQNMYVPLSVLLAMGLLGERAGWRTLSATALSFVGVLVIGLDPLVFRQPDALALVMLSALFQALAAVFMRGLHGMSPMNFQAWTAIFALPVLLAASLILESGQWASIRSADWVHWSAVLYSAILASLVGHGLFYLLVQRHPLPRLMPYMLLTPVLGSVFAVVLWGDRPGIRLMVGGLIVLTGILFITLRGRSKVVTGSEAAVKP